MKDYGKTVVQTIALTWAPNAKLFPQIKPIKQFYEHLKILHNLNKSCHYEIYPEFHLSGNLHYHFIIKIFDKIKWFKHTLVKLRHHGFVYPKPIDNYVGWHKYINKDKLITSDVLDCKVPITNTLTPFDQREVSKDELSLDDLLVPEGEQ